MFISNQNAVFAMDKANAPVLRLPLPARLTFETKDCFSGQIRSAGDTIETLDFDRVNPATGPVYFEGLRPGDVLLRAYPRHPGQPAGHYGGRPGRGCPGRTR